MLVCSVLGLTECWGGMTLKTTVMHGRGWDQNSNLVCQAVRRRREELHKITQTKLNAERGQMRVGVRAETKQKVLLPAGAISSSV